MNIYMAPNAQVWYCMHMQLSGRKEFINTSGMHKNHSKEIIEEAVQLSQEMVVMHYLGH